MAKDGSALLGREKGRIHPGAARRKGLRGCEQESGGLQMPMIRRRNNRATILSSSMFRDIAVRFLMNAPSAKYPHTPRSGSG